MFGNMFGKKKIVHGDPVKKSPGMYHCNICGKAAYLSHFIKDHSMFQHSVSYAKLIGTVSDNPFVIARFMEGGNLFSNLIMSNKMYYDELFKWIMRQSKRNDQIAALAKDVKLRYKNIKYEADIDRMLKYYTEEADEILISSFILALFEYMFTKVLFQKNSTLEYSEN